MNITLTAWQWARDWGALLSTIYVLEGHLLSGWSLSSRGFHPEQLTGYTATVSPTRKFLPNSKLTQVNLNSGSLLWGHINSKASGHSDRIYSIWLSFIISMINHGYAWLIKWFIHIFLSIIDLLSSNLVVLMTRSQFTSDFQSHVECCRIWFCPNLISDHQITTNLAHATTA